MGKCKRRKKAVNFVILKCAHWEPRKYSAMSSKHFLDEDYSVMFSCLTTDNKTWKKNVCQIERVEFKFKFLEKYLRKPLTLKSMRKHIDIDFERVSTVCALALLTKIEILTHHW